MINDTVEKVVSAITIDKTKADNILSWLIRREAENVRTKSSNDIQMISDIRKRIEEEIKCY